MNTKRRNQNQPHSAITQLIPNCQLCNTAYQPAQVSLVDQEGQAQLLHVQCRRCASAMVLLLLVSEHGMGSVGLITDLTQADVLQFSTTPGAITENNVLDVHQLLKSDFIATI